MKNLIPRIKILIFKKIPLLQKVWARMKLKKRLYNQQSLYKKKISALRLEKRPTNVLFFVLLSSNWKWESVYRKMVDDSAFNPLLVVCPVVNQTREYMQTTLRECLDDFQKSNHNVICAYDEKTDTYLDANTLNPDIIFYTNPYEGLVDDRYYIKQFPNVLSCYVNYGYNVVTNNWSNNLEFHNSLWSYFVECDANKRMASKSSPIHGRNRVVTGYPMYDEFILTPKVGDMWKDNSPKYKRVIWAPHHSIIEDPGWIEFSSFLDIAEDMLILAEKYADSIQFVFKPHPLLKPKLYNHPKWGKQKTDEYYAQWANGVNTNFINGEYVDLFNTSDAMIHDCVSFMVEYLYQKKPALYLVTHNDGSQYGEVGTKAYKSHYHGTTILDIEHFIDCVVLNGQDTMADVRIKFYNEYLKPKNGKLVSENIIDYIKSQLSL